MIIFVRGHGSRPLLTCKNSHKKDGRQARRFYVSFFFAPPLSPGSATGAIAQDRLIIGMKCGEQKCIDCTSNLTLLESRGT